MQILNIDFCCYTSIFFVFFLHDIGLLFCYNKWVDLYCVLIVMMCVISNFDFIIYIIYILLYFYYIHYIFIIILLYIL